YDLVLLPTDGRIIWTKIPNIGTLDYDGQTFSIPAGTNLGQYGGLGQIEMNGMGTFLAGAYEPIQASGAVSHSGFGYSNGFNYTTSQNTMITYLSGPVNISTISSNGPYYSYYTFASTGE